MSQEQTRQSSLRKVLWCLYDLLYVVLAAVLYGVAAMPAWALVNAAHGLGGVPAACLAVVPAYVLLLTGVILQVSAIRLVSPRVKPGIYRKFAKGNFFALVWATGLNNLLFATPFMRTINFLAVLRYLFYRGQGMKTHFGNWISVDAVIMDPGLVTLGRNVNIGGMAAITGHVAMHDAMVILPVTIGDNVVVGAASKLGPGVEIGDNALIGAEAALGMRVRVGEGAYVEPFSRVESGTVIGPYEKWAGVPAVKIGMRPRPKPPAEPEATAVVPAADEEADVQAG